MRMLAVERWVTETGPDAFEPNHLTAFVNEAPVEDWVRMKYELLCSRWLCRSESTEADDTLTAST